jgi:cellulose synthase operon protein C
MFRLFHWSCAGRVALLFFLLVEFSGCISQEDRARSYYERGMKFISERDNAKAALELRNAVRLKRDFIEAWKALAEIDEASKDWPRVVSDLRVVVELAPEDISARLKLGKLLLLTGSPNEALTLANAGLDRDDRNADFHALKAALALKLGDRVAAVREAQTTLGLDPTSADALMVLAVDRLSSGDANGALSFLEPITGAEKLENNVGLQLLRIKLFEQTGDLKSAEATLKKLVEQNPREFGYRKLLVDFYVEHHRIEDAEAEMRSLVAANPSDAATALGLVRFLFTTKRAPADARQELNDRINAGGDIFPFKMALAELDFSEGNLNAAKQLLENLIGSAGTSERTQMARIALARIYVSRRSFDPAEKLVDDILHDDSHNVSALTIRATIHLERSKPDAAIPDLVTALAYQPRSVDLMSLLATAYERSGLIELADKQLADAMRASGFDPHIGIDYATFLERRGSLARAEEVLLGLAKRQPKNIQLLSALAQLRLARKNWSGALEIAGSVRRTGDTGTADRFLGASLMGQGRYNDAITSLQMAYRAAPNNAQLLSSLISAFLKANRKDEALAFLKSVLAKSPGNANALVLLGSMQLAGGETDLGMGSFLAAVKAEPKDPVGYQALANLYQHQKNYDEAISIIRKGIQEQPDVTDLQMTLASALEQKGDYETAISQYEAILDKQPDNLIASNNLASLLLDHRTDRPSLKRAQSIAAILRQSKIPQFKDTLGWAKYHQGDYVTAVSLCEEAVADLPDQAAAHYHLGMGYAAVRRADKASEQLKKALELAPDGRLVEEIRTGLKKLGPQPPQPGRPS